MRSRFGAIWGLAGVGLLLASAVYRITPLAFDAFLSPWSWYHWLTFVVVLLFMAYFEGYRAFQKAFSPRVAARARYLCSHSDRSPALLAPLFCMAYFHAPRRRRITSLSVTAGIIILVVLVRLLEQPWRGIIDGGVVVGLAWGLISLSLFGYRAFTDREFSFSPDVPEEL
ncbi:MAG: hypothetical protein M0Z89_07085 [Nitrospiraceae bacterium]|nr:hypothetical protein [Nitrospiraceae bacterium]